MNEWMNKWSYLRLALSDTVCTRALSWRIAEEFAYVSQQLPKALHLSGPSRTFCLPVRPTPRAALPERCVMETALLPSLPSFLPFKTPIFSKPWEIEKDCPPRWEKLWSRTASAWILRGHCGRFCNSSRHPKRTPNQQGADFWAKDRGPPRQHSFSYLEKVLLDVSTSQLKIDASAASNSL